MLKDTVRERFAFRAYSRPTKPLSQFLADISNTVGLENPDNGEKYILQMVEGGEIRAKIESPAGTVRFQEDANVFSSAIMTSRLESDLRKTAELTERVRKLEARLMTNSVFLQKVRHSVSGCGLNSIVPKVTCRP